MKKYINGIFLGALALGFASCDDFLDREPLADLVQESFFTSASNLSAYTANYYNNFPSHSSSGLGTFSNDNGTDNQAYSEYSNQWAPGEWRVPASQGSWSFGNIRSINNFLENAVPAVEAGQVTGTEAEINQALGEAYFFRAFFYYNNYKTLGDFPIITEVLPDDKEILLEQSVRRPRNQVARFILDDLAKAAQYLPATSSKGKNGLNSACASLLRSRVALFEATWLKYHKGTALVPGGPGWPGDQSMLNGFNIDTEINYFFTEAMASAKVVGDLIVNNLVQNTGVYVGQNAALQSQNPYYTMFCDNDLSGYSEVLLYRSYDYLQGIYTDCQMQLQRNGGGTGWTRGLVNSFVMRNGLPIYAAGSGYDPEWENQGVEATLQDRDSRIQIFTKYDNCIQSYQDDGAPLTYNLGVTLLEGAFNSKVTTGFTIKKGMSYNLFEASTGQKGQTGCIAYRATEAMLNYIEACVELNGSPDNTADGYWRALRNRALINPDYNVTIAATDMNQEALGDWGAYSSGQLINPTLYNVRRERRNELIAESLRMDDLRRWAALDQMIETPYFIEGMKFWGTVYTDPSSPLYMTSQIIIDPTSGNMSPESFGPYIHPYQEKTVNNAVYEGYRWTRAHYLSPIGMNDFTAASEDGTVSTTVIYQNPGWPMLTGEAPTNI
ncbi:MAG: RagB/SusD family nutrient uptake outer membrane protein [Paramuribaculum sp.]|nr:RagB/SusD family nutrient uptake outer membrane protein [Paramuribaculum sp.]